MGFYRDNGLKKAYIGIIEDYVGCFRDNGKGNENYYIILGSYWDNGKETGSYYVMIGYICYDCLCVQAALTVFFC